jgi:hypothetical protein
MIYYTLPFNVTFLAGYKLPPPSLGTKFARISGSRALIPSRPKCPSFFPINYGFFAAPGGLEILPRIIMEKKPEHMEHAYP